MGSLRKPNRNVGLLRGLGGIEEWRPAHHVKQIFDRLLGRAREVLEVEVPAIPSTSDADLAASLTALLHRLHPVNG